MNSIVSIIPNKQLFGKLFITIFAILTLIQVKITFFESPSKRFSKSAVIRNIIIGLLCSYSITKYGFNILMLLVFFIVSILIHIILTIIEAKVLTNPIDDYVTATYMYDFHFPKIIKECKNEKKSLTLKSLTEGLYNPQDIGLNLDDTSPENVNRVYDYIEDTFKSHVSDFMKAENSNQLNANNLYKNNVNIKLPDGKMKDVVDIEHQSQIQKFDWVLSHVPSKNKETVRILELGFGEGGFLQHARNRGFKNIIGVNVSQEQVDHALKNGFEVYCKSYWELNDLKLQPFDLIFANGTFEYALPKTANTLFSSDNAETEKYAELYKIINQNLNENGIFCTTFIHLHDKFQIPITDFNFWSLFLGNTGNYPYDTVTKDALEHSGFKMVVCKDATMHYAYWSFLWMLCYYSSPEASLMRALWLSFACPFYLFIHICYSSVPRIFGVDAAYDFNGWLQHFIPKKENGTRTYGSQIANHRWIIAKKINKE